MKISPHRNQFAFTMVEIALCLAIVGFALVAIIGVLPTGMNVQKDNREETIINQDAAVLIDAIRNGAQGFDDLTNYVVAITNYWAPMNPTTFAITGPTRIDYYTPTVAEVTSSANPTPPFVLLNGYRIIGLLSTPRYTKNFTQSNYVVAYFRSMSGAAVEKAPQKNNDILMDAFQYRLIVENTPYLPAETFSNAPNAQLLKILRDNSRDLRLTFRWPVLPNGTIGNSRQTYRLFTGGQITNDVVRYPNLYFFQPSTYAQVQ